jgi:hypothetical protein
MSDDRADHDRPQHVPDGLRGQITVLAPMQVTAIGRTTAVVVSPFPLKLNSLHDVRLVLGERTLVARARVTDAEISGVGPDDVRYRSGLEFVDLPERAIGILEDFLRELRETRAGG